MKTSFLFVNVFVLATCGLAYELLAGTLASYVLGDSITQFSLVIGLYLSAMGVGAWLSRAVTRDIAVRFVEIELAVAIVGGLSAPLLLFAFGRLSWFKLVLYGEVFSIGVLVGLELPLLMRILKESLSFSDLVSRVLSVDYAGALVASLAFPLFFVPRLGLVRTSLLFGIANAGVGLWGTWLLAAQFRNERQRKRVRRQGLFILTVLLVGLSKADKLATWSEDQLFADDIVYSKTSAYQRIVVTQGRAGFQLFLNGNLQFSSADEYRYHEALVHPGFELHPSAHNVLVLDGGDGLALREIEKYPTVTAITLVDLDPAMTALSSQFAPLDRLNQHAFADPRVHVVNADAMAWLDDHPETRFDLAIVDFPDPNNFALGKLYTTRFYRLLRKHLAPQAALTVQATSPLFARTSYWCIVRTLEAAGFATQPYHAAVPSFGVWGFILARAEEPFAPPTHVRAGLRYLNQETLAASFRFPEDMAPVPVEINRLDNQQLVRYYENEWRRFN